MSHQVRITSSGKIKHFVAFALKHFEEHESTPLVLHTLPSKPPDEAPTDLRNATLVVPRLISVVEIIKREYLKSSTRLIGLHQYNELGTLEDLGYGEKQDEADKVASALEGKNHIKLKQIPYLRITLSLEKIRELDKVATYQPPKTRKLSRSAKARAKKRERKKQAASGETMAS